MTPSPFSQRDWAILNNHFVDRGEFKKALWCTEHIDDDFNRSLHKINHLLKIGGDDDIVLAGLIAQDLKDAHPDRAETFHSLGAVYAAKGMAAVAVECYSSAVSIAPNVPKYHADLAFALGLDGRHEESIAHYSEAIKKNQSKVELRTWAAMQQMLSGDWGNGLIQYEARLMHANPCPQDRPMWTGENLSGKTICLYQEQGFGDAIQFVRYAQLLKDRWNAARVIVRCRDSLYRLISGGAICGVDAVYTESMGSDYPKYDFHLPMMSMMYHAYRELGDDFKNVSPVPYINVKSGCSRLDEGLNYGICWRGNTSHLNDRFRSIQLSDIEPLVNDPDIPANWVSLLHGVEFDQERFPMKQVMTTDFYDYAQLVKDLDLVITVDTAVAHLAGAMGVPVYLMLPANPDWRWGTSGWDADWYSDMCIFRQDRLLQWGPVIDDVRSALWGDD